ncbi:MAG: hypothetical protein ITG02_03175 [Patulibacter sp.]|nr:hypothetical protein [Patulibacter sp.]
MAGLHDRSVGVLGEPPATPIGPTRFAPWRPGNSRTALSVSLASEANQRLERSGEPGEPTLVREGIAHVVRLATTAHELTIQRRIFGDAFTEDDTAVISAINGRVQALSTAVVCRSVAALASISEPGVGTSAWRDVILSPANVALVEATFDPDTAIARLPGEIADNLAAALALDRDDALHAAPHLVAAAGHALTLFVMAGLPHPATGAE